MGKKYGLIKISDYKTGMTPLKYLVIGNHHHRGGSNNIRDILFPEIKNFDDIIFLDSSNIHKKTYHKNLPQS